MDPVRIAEQPQVFSQHRRWLKTDFAFKKKHLDYRIESKRDAQLQKTIAWDTIGPRKSYFSTVEPDRDLRWLLFVVTAVALMAHVRGGPQPLTFALYSGVMLAMLAGLWLTAGLRRVGYTAIPAPEINILVLKDRAHDAIVTAIEARRMSSLLRLSEPEPDVPLRIYLRRLRWLAENGVLSDDDVLRRQRLVMPDGPPLVAPAPLPESAPLCFTQWRPGTSIAVELRAARLTYRRASLFGGAETHTIAYRDLREPASYDSTDHQYELTGLIFAWAALAVFAWSGMASQDHPAGYYVGGIGLRRAISDFGPPLLVMAALAAIVPLALRLRMFEPYPGIKLMRGRSGEAILAAIEQRRIAARRALADPDPLLTVDEQLQVLDELYDEGVIDDGERDRAAKRAAFVCNNPALDQPVIEKEQDGKPHAVH